jgi:hypothetical protein
MHGQINSLLGTDFHLLNHMNMITIERIQKLYFAPSSSVLDDDLIVKY